MAFTAAAWDVMLELAPWLLLGAAVAGVVHVLLPPGFVHRNLRGRGSVLKAVLLGVPLPLCSCGVIPAGLGLKRDGASDGASIGFLIATPQTGVDSVLVSASMLGWPFALFKVGSAAVLGLIGGTVTDRLRGSSGGAIAVPSTTRPSWRDGVSHAMDIIETIWKWLVFGVLVSAAITTFVPSEVMAGFAGAGGTWAMLAMLVVSLPLYVCATASVPIAAALVAGGFPPGAALVFLMAGPATNLATIGAVKGAFGMRALAVYLGTIIVGSVALGYLFDFVLEGGGTHHVHEHGGGLLAIVSAIALAAMLVVFAVRELLTKLRPAPEVSGKLISLSVEGLTCDGCVRKLEGTLRTECEDVVVDRAAGRATVSADVEEARVRELIVQAGFATRP